MGGSGLGGGALQIGRAKLGTEIRSADYVIGYVAQK